MSVDAIIEKKTQRGIKLDFVHFKGTHTFGINIVFTTSYNVIQLLMHVHRDNLFNHNNEPMNSQCEQKCFEFRLEHFEWRSDQISPVHTVIASIRDHQCIQSYIKIQGKLLLTIR